MFLAGVISCGIIDGKKYIIPNALTLPLIVFGLIYQGIYGDWGSMLLSLAASAGIGLFGWLSGGLGAGDVKLLAALGVWLKLPDLVLVVIMASALGSLWGVAKLARAGQLRGTFSSFITAIKLFPVLGLGGLATSTARGETDSMHVVPFGSFLAAGLVILTASKLLSGGIAS